MSMRRRHVDECIQMRRATGLRHATLFGRAQADTRAFASARHSPRPE